MLALAGALHAAATPEPATFVQLCDTQLGMGGYEADKVRFELAVDAINDLDADWVVVCGDLVNNGHDDEAVADFKAILAGFSMPVYLAPGNHDVGNEPTMATLDRYRRQYGPDYFVAEEHGFKLMILNTQLWKAPVEGASEAHDAWFKRELASSRQYAVPTLLISHYPPFTGAPDEEESYYNLPPETRAAVLDLAKAAGVKAWLAGHVHKNLLLDYGGMPVVASATTSRNFDGAPYGYRVWTVAEDGTLSHDYQALDIPEGAIPEEEAGEE